MVKIGICVLIAVSIPSLVGLEVWRCRRAQQVAQIASACGGTAVMTAIYSGKKVSEDHFPIAIRMTELLMGDYVHFQGFWAARGGHVIDNEFTPRPTSALLRQASDLGTVQILILDGTEVTTSRVAEFTNRSQLEALGISYTKCDESIIRELSNCRRLKVLRCDGIPIRDDSIDDLLKLPQLTYLDIANTQVTEAGIVRLCESRTLRHLRIVGLAVGASQLEQLRKKYPHVRIIVDDFE